MTDTEYVGKRLPRYDGMQHATGRTRFVGDIKLPGMLHVQAWRSPVASARIRDIDIRRAKATPGVVAVITGKDVPNNVFGGEQPVLADREIRYLGQEVVAVAAETLDAAREAVSRVRVELEARPPVLDPIQAMDPASTKVRPDGNLMRFGERDHLQIRKGDVEQGFAQADRIVQTYFRTAAQEHSPIETQSSIAQTDSMGRTHIHTVTQAVFFNQGTIAGILGKPQAAVHMIGGILGGGFGSKNDPHGDHICAVLSLYTGGRPVRWVWTREEEFVASTHRAATHIWFKDGVTKEGRILARKIKMIRDGGAYPSTNDYVIRKASYGIAGPYNIPNVWIDSYSIFTNKRPTSSMRGFGLFQSSFAWDVQMERIAEALGLDSWRLRFLNAIRDGDTSATRAVQHHCGLIEVMQTAAQRAGIRLDGDLLAMSSQQGSNGGAHG
ncbi:MAG TPA: molybdopterin cofactor-binding domain-containing protein [Anaerolineales bacterium]|nr:molybdopterin cofactor-binding domain-containing protein [Anaerolineales bacterium]